MAAPESSPEPAAGSPAVTIVVVSYNTRDLLDACLRSMRDDTEEGRAEVWVVDNGSTDGSPEMVRERHPWVEVDVPGENLGFGPAVNRIAARTAAPWLAPSNADVELAPGALRALVEEGARRRDAGALGPRLILPDGSTQASVQPFPSFRQSLAAAFELPSDGGAVRDAWDPGRPATVPWVTGAFVLVRRRAFEQVGGFDEQVWMYGEDLDLCWRLARAGWTTRYEPAAIVHHHESAPASEAFGDALSDRWRRASWTWMARRRGLPETWAAAAVGAAGALGRLAVASPLARRSERWRLRRERARDALHHSALGLRPPGRLLRDDRP